MLNTLASYPRDLGSRPNWPKNWASPALWHSLEGPNGTRARVTWWNSRIRSRVRRTG